MSIQDDIIAAAKKYGVDPATMLAIAQIESKFDPNAYNKSGASGVFQFMPETASDYGLSDPFDAAANIDAGARLARDNIAALTKRLGRAPTAGEIYLAHQQGLGGAGALLAYPNLSAVDALVKAGVSRSKAIASVQQNGGDPNTMTAGQFAGLWTGKADKYAANYAGTPGTALNAINSAAPNGINPLAYAPTPAGLPTMDRSGLIPPIPAAPPTMNRSGPPTALPPPAPLTITLPNGSVVIPGKPYVGKDGSVTTFDASGNRTHVNPPLVNIGEEMGKNTIIGGLARKYGADFMDQGKAAVQSGLNTAGTAAMDLAASLPTKVADLGAGLGGLFGFGGAPKPPLLTPGGNAAPGVPPKSAPFIGSSGIPMPTKPVASLPVSTVSEHAPMLSPLPAPTVPPSSAFAPFNYGQFYGSNAGVSGIGYAPPPLPAPLVGMTPALERPAAPLPPLRQVNVPPAPVVRPIQPDITSLIGNALRSGGYTVTGNNKGVVAKSGSGFSPGALIPTKTISGGVPNYLKGF